MSLWIFLLRYTPLGPLVRVLALWYWRRYIHEDVMDLADALWDLGVIDADEHSRMYEAEKPGEIVWVIRRLDRIEKGLY